MTAPFLAWSYSRLKQFRECPRQLWHSVAPKGHEDRVEFRQTPAMLAGLEVDDALTARVSKGQELPPKYAIYEPMMQMIIASPGQKFCQMKLALDQSLKPCGYMDWDTAWVRVIYDLAIVHGEHAFIWDWKNGQVWLDEDQLRLFATVGFHQFPEIEVIDTSYIWLKHGVTSDATHRRRELPDLWETFLPDVERMQVAHKTGHWPAAPARGKASCKWCPANQAKRCKEAQGPYGG
jgi:hypothetical protein